MKEIIQKNGKYWKECDIVMLPTKNISQIVKQLDVSSLNLQFVNKEWKKTFNWESQHLYLLSNEQINEGDYYFDKEDKIIFKCFDKQEAKARNDSREIYEEDRWFKIIASTDSSLTVEMIGSQILDRNKSCEDYGFKSGIGLLSHIKVESLPKLTEDFIKKYVESNGKMDKILVEYEEIINYGCVDIFDENTFSIHTNKYKLKLNPDNTINILLENSVEEAAKQYAYGKMNEGNSYRDFKAGVEWLKNQLNN